MNTHPRDLFNDLVDMFCDINNHLFMNQDICLQLFWSDAAISPNGRYMVTLAEFFPKWEQVLYAEIQILPGKKPKVIVVAATRAAYDAYDAHIDAYKRKRNVSVDVLMPFLAEVKS